MFIFRLGCVVLWRPSVLRTVIIMKLQTVLRHSLEECYALIVLHKNSRNVIKDSGLKWGPSYSIFAGLSCRAVLDFINDDEVEVIIELI